MPDRKFEDVELERRRINRLVAGLLTLAALLLALAAGAAALSAKRISDDTRLVEHTLEVRAAIYAVGNFAERVETARRGYVISGDRQFAAAVRRSHARMRATLSNLDSLVADNAEQRAKALQVRALSDRKWPLVVALLDNRDAVVSRTRPTELFNDETVRLIRSIRSVLEAMDATEVRLLVDRQTAQTASLSLFATFGTICVILLVLVVAATAVLFARYNRDLARAQNRLRFANEGLEVAVAARTTELQRANDEIQRFAYIVSHDLRSPLVNVLGFTSELDEARKTLHRHLAKVYEDQPDLRDDAAWLAVDEDLPEALGFIRTSTEKMDRLINSILELSRQGRRNLTPERLDMTALAEGVAATMHQRAEAAGAEVTVSALPEIESDRIAVEQIVANLVENALKYLSPARSGVVSVEGQRNGRNVEVSVVDNGRGIAPADQERIFELFRRAGTQDQPGEGIGLANVRALAYRLGGRIAVESELNKGSRFTLILPEKFTVETAS